MTLIYFIMFCCGAIFVMYVASINFFSSNGKKEKEKRPALKSFTFLSKKEASPMSEEEVLKRLNLKR